MTVPEQKPPAKRTTKRATPVKVAAPPTPAAAVVPAEPHYSHELLTAQMAECWADIRNYDALLWQIPAAISAIGGLMINALMQRNSAGGTWIRPFIAGGAAFVTFPLIVALVKNRMFQTDRNNWRIALFKHIVNDDKGAPTVADINPESNAATKGIVLLSSGSLPIDSIRGPWFWTLATKSLRRVSAFDVLLFVSFVVFLVEVILAIIFSIFDI